MKKLQFIIVLLLSVLSVSAQRMQKANGAQQAKMISVINATAASIKTIIMCKTSTRDGEKRVLLSVVVHSGMLTGSRSCASQKMSWFPASPMKTYPSF